MFFVSYFFLLVIFNGFPLRYTIGSQTNEEETEMSVKFYKCNVCGNIICKIEDSGMPLSCCRRQMTELTACTSEETKAKHNPIFEYKDGYLKVSIGSNPHPTEDEHHVQFIVVETSMGIHIKKVDVPHKAIACFKLCETEYISAVYSLCSLHGIFVTQ